MARIITQRPDATCEDGVKWIEDLCGKLNVPKLSTYGLQESDLEVVAQKAAKSSSMKGNSLMLTAEELTAVLKAAL